MSERELVAQWGAEGWVLVRLFRDSRGWICEAPGIEWRLPPSAQSVAFTAVERLLKRGVKHQDTLYSRDQIKRIPHGNGGAL